MSLHSLVKMVVVLWLCALCFILGYSVRDHQNPPINGGGSTSGNISMATGGAAGSGGTTFMFCGGGGGGEGPWLTRYVFPIHASCP